MRSWRCAWRSPVSPTQTPPNHRHIRPRDPMLPSQRHCYPAPMRCRKDGGDDRVGNAATLRVRHTEPPLGRRVFHVRVLVAEKEMIRIDAARRIAPMQHMLSRRNRPVREHPRGTVRLDRRLPRSGDLAVAVSVYAGHPQPARLGLLDEHRKPREKARPQQRVRGRLTIPAILRANHARRRIARMPTASESYTGCYVN